MASEDFDLGHDIRVRKTCSVGYAPFPWSRRHYEAVCAEEVIELADTALYRAKAGGRNLGIGILPNESSLSAPGEINLQALRNDKGSLTQTVAISPTCQSIPAYSLAEDLTTKNREFDSR
jgi:hypothetical protein